MPTEQATIEDLEARVSEVDEEIAELSRRRNEAADTIRRAQRRFEELAERRKVLSPMSFSGDEDASSRLESLEDEHDALARSVRVAESALPEFERFLRAAKERRDEAQVAVHKARAAGIYAKLKRIEDKRDALAAQLDEVLEEHQDASGDYSQAVRLYDGDAANRMASAAAGRYRRWFGDAFSRWLR